MAPPCPLPTLVTLLQPVDIFRGLRDVEVTSSGDICAASRDGGTVSIMSGVTGDCLTIIKLTDDTAALRGISSSGKPQSAFPTALAYSQGFLYVAEESQPYVHVYE